MPDEPASRPTVEGRRSRSLSHQEDTLGDLAEEYASAFQVAAFALSERVENTSDVRGQEDLPPV